MATIRREIITAAASLAARAMNPPGGGQPSRQALTVFPSLGLTHGEIDALLSGGRADIHFN